MKPRKVPVPWKVEQIPGGYRVDDAERKAVAYYYGFDPRGLLAAGHLRRIKDAARSVA